MNISFCMITISFCWKQKHFSNMKIPNSRKFFSLQQQVIIPFLVFHPQRDVPCVFWGSFAPNTCGGAFSIDPGVSQATSHGFGLFMQRRSNFFWLLPSQGPPFFSVTQRCVCAYLSSSTKEGRDPFHFCLWHSPLVFTIFPRRTVCTVEQALSWRRGTMASAIM